MSHEKNTWFQRKLFVISDATTSQNKPAERSATAKFHAQHPPCMACSVGRSFFEYAHQVSRRSDAPIDLQRDLGLQWIHAVHLWLQNIPIGSMYAIYANIGGILMVNVTIYSIHGSYGIQIYVVYCPVSIIMIPRLFTDKVSNCCYSTVMVPVPRKNHMFNMFQRIIFRCRNHSIQYIQKTVLWFFMPLTCDNST